MAKLPVKLPTKGQTLAHIITAIISALLSSFLGGCAYLQEPASPALVSFSCRVDVLAPYVAEAAPVIVSQISSGTVNPVELLLSLGLSPDEILSVAKAYNECKPVVPETPAEPASVVKA
jgi:hypothetical protein